MLRGFFVKQTDDNLDQPVLRHFQMAMMIFGSILWIAAIVTDVSFDPRVYGQIALMFPAELWAGMITTGAALASIGLQHPIKRYQVLIGGVVSTPTFFALGVSAMFKGGEPIIGIFILLFIAPLYFWMTLEAAQNVRKRTG